MTEEEQSTKVLLIFKRLFQGQPKPNAHEKKFLYGDDDKDSYLVWRRSSIQLALIFLAISSVFMAIGLIAIFGDSYYSGIDLSQYTFLGKLFLIAPAIVQFLSLFFGSVALKYWPELEKSSKMLKVLIFAIMALTLVPLVVPQELFFPNYDHDNAEVRGAIGVIYSVHSLTFFFTTFKAVIRGAFISQRFVNENTRKLVGWIIVFYAPIDIILLFTLLIAVAYGSGATNLLVAGAVFLLINPIMVYCNRSIIVEGKLNKASKLRGTLFGLTCVGFALIGAFFVLEEVKSWSELLFEIMFSLGGFFLDSVLVADIFYSISGEE
jgi:hypothetical protein